MLSDKLYQELAMDFSTLPNSMWTLAMDATLLLDGSAIFTELLYSGEVHCIISGIICVGFTLITALCILQMLIGVLCDVVTRVGAADRNGGAVALMKQAVVADLNQYIGENGKVTKDQLLTIMNTPKSRAVLRKLNINQLFLLELQKAMFSGGNNSVSIKAIIELMLMCRGDNPATVEALASGFSYVVQEIYDMRDELFAHFRDMHISNVSNKDSINSEGAD